MRAYAHIVAVVLALALVAKPCASALAAIHKADDTAVPAAQLAQSVQDQSIVLKNKKKCTSSCLKARVEKFNWRGVEHKRAHTATRLANTSIAALFPSRWDNKLARSRAGPDPHVAHRAARKVLHELCRQLI